MTRDKIILEALRKAQGEYVPWPRLAAAIWGEDEGSWPQSAQSNITEVISQMQQRDYRVYRISAYRLIDKEAAE
jgi:hypothetical protein